MRYFTHKLIALVCLFSILAALIFTATALAASPGDPCDRSKPPPTGFTCTDCGGSTQATQCFLKQDNSLGQQTTTTSSSSSQASTACAKPSFFFLPPWYEYLTLKTDDLGQCVPVFNFPNDIWAVVLAIIDMLLRLGGFIAILSIIISGAQFIFSGGNPERAVAARWRIYNSLIGLAIISIATATVTFIGKQFT